MQVIIAPPPDSVCPFAPSLAAASTPLAGEAVVTRVVDRAVTAGATEVVVLGDEGVRSAVDARRFDAPIRPVAREPRWQSAVADTLDEHSVAVLSGYELYDVDSLSTLFEYDLARGRRPEGMSSERDADAPVGACVVPSTVLRDHLETATWPTARALIERVDPPEHVSPVAFRRVHDVRRSWEYLGATERLLESLDSAIEGTVHRAAICRGPVVVEADATVDAGVVIEGPTLVRAGATVGPNAYVRGSTVLGRGVHVGQGVEVKNSVLMHDVSVPHLSYVGDSVLGPHVNVGAGSIVANLRHDDQPVRAAHDGVRSSTGRRKFGSVVGESSKLGIGTRLNAGVTLSSESRTAPGETVVRDR